MTSLLYYEISSKLTQEEIIKIDQEVHGNRIKSKQALVIVTISFGLWLSTLKPTQAIGSSAPPVRRIEIVQNSYPDVCIPKAAPQVIPKVDKIAFSGYNNLPSYIYTLDGRVLRTASSMKLITKLRGGSLAELTVALIFIIVMSQLMGVGIEGFVIPDRNLGILNNPFQPQGGHLNYPPSYGLLSSPKPTSSMTVVRPTSVPHNDFVAMPKAARRNLAHKNDMVINQKGHQTLTVGFWQAQFKVKDHGAVHDLPYTITSQGGTKTEKSEANALAMMRSIVDMPNRPNIRWFDNGTYQGTSNRAYGAVHIYDLDTRTIATFNKSTGKFITTCQLTVEEQIELLETGNFGGGKGWFSGKVRNVPPDKSGGKFSFPSRHGDAKTSPIKNLPENSSPINSFESDVMGISPINDSQLDNL